MSNVTLTYDGSLAVIRLENESRLNALTMGMLRQIAEYCDAVEANPDLRALVVTGAGSKAFCCGADISEWGPMTPSAFARDWVRSGHRVFDRLARLGKPTIGALNGHAFGGGLELAACCDIRVMTPHATLALPEARVGIVPGWSGTQRVARLMPEPVLKELALFGRRLTADRALGFGFVAEVAEDTLAVARDIASALKDVSPRANELAKSMIHAARGEDAAAGIEALASAAAASSDDRNEGVDAFLNKRTADFTGF